MAALLMGCLFLFSCENSQEEIDALSKKKIGREEATGIVSYMSQGGKMKAKLTSPLMYRYVMDSSVVEFPRTLHVDFYNDSTLSVESQLSAMYGKYLEAENKVYLRDSIVIFNVKGDTLHCEDLWWYQSEQKFVTGKPVRVYSPDKIIYAVGMEASQDFKTYKFFKVTNSTFRVASAEFPD
jgi:LPS export ABC transporter protein LptC